MAGGGGEWKKEKERERLTERERGDGGREKWRYITIAPEVGDEICTFCLTLPFSHAFFKGSAKTCNAKKGLCLNSFLPFSCPLSFQNTHTSSWIVKPFVGVRGHMIVVISWTTPSFTLEKKLMENHWKQKKIVRDDKHHLKICRLQSTN